MSVYIKQLIFDRKSSRTNHSKEISKHKTSCAVAHAWYTYLYLQNESMFSPTPNLIARCEEYIIIEGYTPVHF